MTKEEIKLVASGFAAAEALVFTPDALASLQFAASTIADRIALTQPRFSRGQFEIDCFPRTHAAKAARVKASLSGEAA
jgi:hypothetical protein